MRPGGSFRWRTSRAGFDDALVDGRYEKQSFSFLIVDVPANYRRNLFAIVI
jgi:hypothetical protein